MSERVSDIRHRLLFCWRWLSPGLLITSVCLSSSCVYRGVGTRVRTEPVQIVDASTGAAIRDVLVVPRYSGFIGTGIIPEGPSRGRRRYYLASPFVYHAGDPFVPHQPTNIGVMLGTIYTGGADTLEGVLVFAPHYRRQWFTDLWPRAVKERKLMLTRTSDQASSRELQVALAALLKDKLTMPEECSFWEPSSACPLDVRLKSRERKLVRSFFNQARESLNESP